MSVTTLEECEEATYFATPDYHYCVPECAGEYKQVQGSSVCGCADRYEEQSLENGGHACVAKCPADQVRVDGKCTCKDGFTVEADG